MPETIRTDKHIIRYKGLFDFDGLYNLVAAWIKSRKYWFHEGKYKHKVPSPAGAEQEITFTGEKQVTEYYSEHIQVDFHLWDMTEVEVDQNGMKKTLTNARMEIVISGKLLLDIEGRYENNRFLLELRHFMHKYVIKEDIETVAYDELRYRMYKLHKVMKDYLDMQTKGNEYMEYLKDK